MARKIYRLATHPDHRRGGISPGTGREAEKVLDGWGVKRATALVDEESSLGVPFNWQAVGYTVMRECLIRQMFCISYAAEQGLKRGKRGRSRRPLGLMKVTIDQIA